VFHLKVRPGYDCDIIVVGAGPAGASAAAHATRAGLKVVLIDQHKFPRDKVCGDFVSPLALVELRRLGVTANPEYRKSNIIHSAAVHVDGKTLITSLIPDVPGLPSHGVVAPRMALDAWILQAAVSAGTQLYEGYRVKDYHVDEDAVVVHAEQSGAARGAQRQWRARLLIGADGSSSIIARVMHGRGPLKKDRILAVRAYFTDQTVNQRIGNRVVDIQDRLPFVITYLRRILLFLLRTGKKCRQDTKSEHNVLFHNGLP